LQGEALPQLVPGAAAAAMPVPPHLMMPPGIAAVPQLCPPASNGPVSQDARTLGEQHLQHLQHLQNWQLHNMHYVQQQQQQQHAAYMRAFQQPLTVQQGAATTGKQMLVSPATVKAEVKLEGAADAAGKQAHEEGRTGESEENPQQHDGSAHPGKTQCGAEVKQRKRQLAVERSPWPATQPAPNPTGWRVVKDPRDEHGSSMIWAAEARNDVEMLSSILVVERKETASRFLCCKCHYMFWGSKKRVKEHLFFGSHERLSRTSAWLRMCNQPMTEEEKLLLEREPWEPAAQVPGRGFKGEAKVCRGSPFPTSEPRPSPEGWASWKAPDGTDIWVSDATNSVERMGVVLVIERRARRDRFFCTKCNLLFWGDVEVVKQHLRRASSLVSPCFKGLTSSEAEVVKAHDEGREGEATSMALALANKRRIMRRITTSRSSACAVGDSKAKQETKQVPEQAAREPCLLEQQGGQEQGERSDGGKEMRPVQAEGAACHTTSVPTPGAAQSEAPESAGAAGAAGAAGSAGSAGESTSVHASAADGTRGGGDLGGETPDAVDGAAGEQMQVDAADEQMRVESES